MKKIKFGVFVLALASLFAGVMAYAASRYKIYMNGVVISNHVVILHRKPYVPLADLSRALNLKVRKTRDGWSISQGTTTTSQGQTSQNAAPKKTLPLTNIPAKVDRDANNWVVVNNIKANVNGMANMLWFLLNNPTVQSDMSSVWTPPMTIKGQTYGNGYTFQFGNGGHETLIYWLKGRHYTKLTATLGLDDHLPGDAGAAFKVTFTGNGKILKTITVSSNNNPTHVSVPISGIMTLRIKVSLLGSCPCLPGLDIVNPTLSK